MGTVIWSEFVLLFKQLHFTAADFFFSKKVMVTCPFQKVEISCNNAYFLLFLAKKSKQKTLRLTKNAVLLLPRSGGAKKNSPHI
jgi:hypothetical protein